jgi:hypothetical protein
MLLFFLLGPSTGPAETSSEEEEKCKDAEQTAQEHPHHIQQVVLHKSEAVRGTSHGGVMRMPDTESKQISFFPVVKVFVDFKAIYPKVRISRLAHFLRKICQYPG